jgi:16S rRNA (cytidine1402-2'-O)-methyltransferase
MPTLYLVATPLGNLEDITLRALRVLREARLIAAEDTRHTRTLLDRYQITTPCVSYHEHNKLARLGEILDALAAGDVALVSDLVASGLPPDRFAFVGFLPRRGAERRALLAEMAELTLTLVCFEAPHRLLDALGDMLAILGDRRAVAANDLTKRFEELRRGTLAELVTHFSAQRPRGEYTLVVEGRAPGSERKRDRNRLAAPAELNEPPSEAEIARRLRLLRAQGHNGSAAARAVARELGLQKSVVYNVWLSLGEEE